MQTVAYGAVDYKFKNTLKYPIYIESIVTNEEVVLIYIQIHL